MLPQPEVHMKLIFAGNLLFTLCSIFYLIWWSVVFKPGAHASTVKSAVLLVVTAFFGLLGCMLIIYGIKKTPLARELFPSAVCVLAGIVLYVVLLFLTSKLFHRQITSELLLIISWGVLVLCEINTLYGSGRFSRGVSIGLCVVILVAVMVSMVCYLLYYRLEAMKAYVDGMIPLMIVGGVVALIALFQKIYSGHV